VEVKRILESSGTLETILSNLTKDPHSKFSLLFSSLKESKCFFHYEEGVLAGFSTSKEVMGEASLKAKEILKENNFEVLKTLPSEDGLGYSVEISLLKKEVNEYCR